MLLTLLAESGIVAKLVLLCLLGTSVLCWAIIITKWWTFQAAHRQDESFMATFWAGKNLDDIVHQTENYAHSPVAALFKNGVKEFRKLSGGPAESGFTTVEKIENVSRALNRASVHEIATLEKHIGWLATTASAAPFIGLFGTVWGIMNSFQNIGATGSANLAIVAPGISEALITTAAGIGVAIPAVIAYNYFSTKIRSVSSDMDCFSQDFMNIIQRSLIHGRKDPLS